MILFGGLRVASRFVFLKTLRSHDALAPVISCIPSLEQITTYSPPPPSYDPNTNKTPAGLHRRQDPAVCVLVYARRRPDALLSNNIHLNYFII